MAANLERGEIDLVLEDGVDPIVLRPTFEGQVEIEKRTGHGLMMLRARFQAQAQTVDETIAVLSAFGGVPKERARTLIEEYGLLDPIGTEILLVLTNAMIGKKRVREAVALARQRAEDEEKKAEAASGENGS